MHYQVTAIAALVAGAQAFPAVANMERAVSSEKLPKPNPVRLHEANSGFEPNLVFDPKDQFVDVRPGSGHEFVPPMEDDIRGPCPGLNAAANHNFIDHSGVIDIIDTTRGLQEAYSFGTDFSLPLFFFATFNSGNFIDEKWSIGGPMGAYTNAITNDVLGKGLGISNSHNRYEGDSSPGRGDAYLHDGDAHSLNIPNYSNMYFDRNAEGNFDYITMRRQVIRTHEFTIQNNPYGFFGPVFFVSPIAHQFILAMMSNHSETEKQGVLTPDVLNSFFSVKEYKDKTLEWIPGHDSIPLNWYKRPNSNPYGIEQSFGDFGITCAQYPEICDVGGNMGKANDYVGLEFEDLTGGTFNSANLLKGNNLACLGLEGLTFATPGLAQKLETGKAGSLAGKAAGALAATKSKLSCPQLQTYDTKQFEKYPGYTHKYKVQPATPY